MTEQQSSALIQRLERLEQEGGRWKREQRWWKLAGSGAVVVLVLMAVLLGRATKGESDVKEEIRARSFLLMDREGRMRGILGHSDSNTYLTLNGFEKEGEFGHGPMLSVRDNGDMRLDFTHKKGQISIVLPRQDQDRGVESAQISLSWFENGLKNISEEDMGVDLSLNPGFTTGHFAKLF